MQYIDKKNPENSTKGHGIIDSFIESAWNDEDNCYIGLTYDKLKYDCPSLLNLLIDEQKGYCCYCMRKLSIGQNTTIEHVIPKSIVASETEEIEYYEKYGQLNRESIYVSGEHTLTSKLRTPPYPHFIAYENLVASCNGKLLQQPLSKSSENITGHCCNNRRGSNKIVPLFFFENVSELISYATDGTIVFDEFNEEYDNTLKKINLKDNKTLSLVRKLWYLVSKQDYSIMDVNDAISCIEKRKDIIDDCLGFENPSTNDMFLENTNLWRLFSEFEWFFTYYSHAT